MIFLKISGVHTSTIGSFPLDDSAENRERCIKDLLNIGIDFPSYPQLYDMGRQFLDDLVKQSSAIVLEKDRYRLKDEKINETVSPIGIEPFFWTLRYLKEKSLINRLELKAAITGPFTLASYIEIKPGIFPFNTAASDVGLVQQITRVLVKSCEVVSKEADLISIDEPILGVIVGARMPFGVHEEEIIDIYDSLKRASGDKAVGTHICGRISPLMAKTLLGTKLDFISHEFFDSPLNIKAYVPKEVKKSGKVLSVGCLSSKKPRLESPDEILEVMKKFRIYGDDLIFSPDCGFRPLIVDGSKEKGYKTSIKKLRNMVVATDKYRSLS